MQNMTLNKLLTKAIDENKNFIVIGNNEMANTDILEYLYDEVMCNEKYSNTRTLRVNMQDKENVKNLSCEDIDFIENCIDENLSFTFFNLYGLTKDFVENIDEEFKRFNCENGVQYGILMANMIANLSKIIISFEKIDILNLKQDFDKLKVPFWDSYVLEVKEYAQHEDILLTAYCVKNGLIEEIRLK